jgi:hypothetical protein
MTLNSIFNGVSMGINRKQVSLRLYAGYPQNGIKQWFFVIKAQNITKF